MLPSAVCGEEERQRVGCQLPANASPETGVTVYLENAAGTYEREGVMELLISPSSPSVQAGTLSAWLTINSPRQGLICSANHGNCSSGPKIAACLGGVIARKQKKAAPFSLWAHPQTLDLRGQQHQLRLPCEKRQTIAELRDS